MTTMIEEPVVLIVEDLAAEGAAGLDWEDARAANHGEVLTANREAAVVDPETLAAFLELIYDVDEEYIDTGFSAAPSEPLMNWDEVGTALAESQAMLMAMQDLLSVILEEIGVEDHASIRIYEDPEGKLRLVSPHERREEIEETLNSPVNRQLQELYRSVANGMSLAGSLVGNGALPEEVLEKVKGRVVA